MDSEQMHIHGEILPSTGVGTVLGLLATYKYPAFFLASPSFGQIITTVFSGVLTHIALFYIRRGLSALHGEKPEKDTEKDDSP